MECYICSEKIEGGGPIPRVYVSAGWDEPVHDNCFRTSDAIEFCVICNQPWMSNANADGSVMDGSNFYCPECAREHSYCARCGDFVADDEMHQVGGDWWCDSCTADHAYTCVACEEMHDAEGVHFMHDGRALCHSCYEYGDYAWCEGCGELYHLDDLNWCETSEEYFCYDCEDSCDGPVHGYHDGPQLETFFQNGQVVPFDHIPDANSLRLTVGVEVECETGYYAVAEENDGYDVLWKAETDGSLPEGGVEIITAVAWFDKIPDTKEFAHHAVFASAFAEVAHIGNGEHVGPSTGGHIHIGRDYINHTLGYGSDGHYGHHRRIINKSLQAAGDDVTELITTYEIAGRLRGNYCRKMTKGAENDFRYAEVNIAPLYTVEFRRPRSPRDAHDAWRKLMWALAIIEAAKAYVDIAKANNGQVPDDETGSERALRLYAKFLLERAANLDLSRRAMEELRRLALA